MRGRPRSQYLAAHCFWAQPEDRVNRVATIFQGPSLVVERFDHAEHCLHRDEGPEVTQSIAVTFVESGDFEIVESKQRWRFNQFDVLLSVPATPRTYRHDLECPTDVCLTLSYAPELVEEALGRLPRSVPPKVAAGVASGFALGRIRRALKSADAMAIESVAFDCTVAIGPYSWQGTGKLKGATAHARRIENACEAMRAGLAEDRSLTVYRTRSGNEHLLLRQSFPGVGGPVTASVPGPRTPGSRSATVTPGGFRN
jgi:hypothetical protein